MLTQICLILVVDTDIVTCVIDTDIVTCVIDTDIVTCVISVLNGIPQNDIN